jgi:long-chain fatty acid transport protein
VGSIRSTACALACLLAANQARAGGLYFSDRGVRPMGRAGAFVAGADDLGLVWYNPAGLADAGPSVLVDFGWLDQSDSYTRQLLVLDASNTWQRFNSPSVNGASPILPIPTLAASFNLGERKQWTVAAGALAPYVALATYPGTVAGQPSPARYSMGSLSGSALAIPGVWVAYKANDELSIGAGAMLMTGVFQSAMTFSASPKDRLLGAPEQPEFDANARLRVGPIFAPTMNAGVIWSPLPGVRAGLSGQLPIVISAPATVQMQMPSSVVFDGARQEGTAAHVRFVLPAILRAGIELRPLPDLRVELAYVRELWSAHRSIEVTPEGMALAGIAGMPKRILIPPITIPRNYQDSNSYRLGGEYHLDAGGVPLELRAGISYETSAVPDNYLSLSSLDFDKLTLSSGASVHLGAHWRLDVVFAHLFSSSVYVDPGTAQLPRINPIKGTGPLEAVNGGWYSADTNLFGLGMNYKF